MAIHSHKYFHVDHNLWLFTLQPHAWNLTKEFHRWIFHFGRFPSSTCLHLSLRFSQLILSGWKLFVISRRRFLHPTNLITFASMFQGIRSVRHSMLLASGLWTASRYPRMKFSFFHKSGAHAENIPLRSQMGRIPSLAWSQKSRSLLIHPSPVVKCKTLTRNHSTEIRFIPLDRQLSVCCLASACRKTNFAFAERKLRIFRLVASRSRASSPRHPPPNGRTKDWKEKSLRGSRQIFPTLIPWIDTPHEERLAFVADGE